MLDLLVGHGAGVIASLLHHFKLRVDNATNLDPPPPDRAHKPRIDLRNLNFHPFRHRC
jgi:hypothetical protein